MVIRQHWSVVCKRGMWPALLVAAVALRIFLDTRGLVRIWSELGPLLPRGTSFAAVLHYANLADMVLFALGMMHLLGAIGWWYASSIVLDDVALIVRTPFSSNAIPLDAIQDVQTAHTWLGFLFGYGTLLVYSGEEVERIEEVPRVEAFAERLYHHRRQGRK